MRARRLPHARMGVCAVALLLLGAGCSGSEEQPAERQRAERQPAGQPAERRPAPPPAPERERAEPAAKQPVACPRGLEDCRTADGRILYVEAVDPDGDGDAHFVLLSDESITGPGISIIDVPKRLRPSPLPGPGDRLSGAGPVHTGSHRQKQIEAVRVRVLSR